MGGEWTLRFQPDLPDDCVSVILIANPDPHDLSGDKKFGGRGGWRMNKSLLLRGRFASGWEEYPSLNLEKDKS